MDHVLQIIMIVCLLIIIILLVVDKIKINKNHDRKTGNNEKVQVNEIIGKPKEMRERFYNTPKVIDKKEGRSTQLMPFPENVSDVANSQSAGNDQFYDEWDDEPLPYDDRFNQGVSMDELMKAGKLLQQNSLMPEQEHAVIDVMQKIQGTELYGLLENSIGDASRRIAIILDKNLKTNEYTTDNTHDSFGNFDIQDFI